MGKSLLNAEQAALLQAAVGKAIQAGNPEVLGDSRLWAGRAEAEQVLHQKPACSSRPAAQSSTKHPAKPAAKPGAVRFIPGRG